MTQFRRHLPHPQRPPHDPVQHQRRQQVHQQVGDVITGYIQSAHRVIHGVRQVHHRPPGHRCVSRRAQRARKWGQLANRGVVEDRGLVVEQQRTGQAVAVHQNAREDDKSNVKPHVAYPTQVCASKVSKPVQRRSWMRGAWLVALSIGVSAAVGCAAPAAPNFTDRLHLCSAEEGPTDAYCGGYDVFEDRDARAGKTIRLNIVVLPSIGADVLPDPLVFLAGGPGQGAAQMAGLVQAAFRSVQRTREIVRVDQRAPGKSNPLNGRSGAESLREVSEPDEAALDRLKACLAQLPGDPRLYTTTIAMDDLDDVRAFLGYGK